MNQSNANDGYMKGSRPEEILDFLCISLRARLKSDHLALGDQRVDAYRDVMIALKNRLRDDLRFERELMLMPAGDPLRRISYYWINRLRKVKLKVDELKLWDELGLAFHELKTFDISFDSTELYALCEKIRAQLPDELLVEEVELDADNNELLESKLSSEVEGSELTERAYELDEPPPMRSPMTEQAALGYNRQDTTPARKAYVIDAHARFESLPPERQREILKQQIKQRTELAVKHRRSVAQAEEDEQANILDPFAKPDNRSWKRYRTLNEYLKDQQ